MVAGMIPRIPPPSIARTFILGTFISSLAWECLADPATSIGSCAIESFRKFAGLENVSQAYARCVVLPVFIMACQGSLARCVCISTVGQQVEMLPISAYPVKIRIAVIPTRLYFEIWDTPSSRFSIPGIALTIAVLLLVSGGFRARGTRAGECV